MLWGGRTSHICSWKSRLSLLMSSAISEGSTPLLIMPASLACRAHRSVGGALKQKENSWLAAQHDQKNSRVTKYVIYIALLSNRCGLHA